MINRYSLLAFAGVVFCLTSSAYAQTVKDAPSNIQAVLQKFSEMRTQLKQAQSSLNIEKMAANAAGNYSEIKKVMKKKKKGEGEAGAEDDITDTSKKTKAQELATLILPKELLDSVENMDASLKWMQNELKPKKGATTQEVIKTRKKTDEFQYVALATSYGKAVATRKKLDKSLKAIEKLRQDAEKATSEAELKDHVNKLGLLRIEQQQIATVLKETKSYAENLDKMRVAQNNDLEEDEDSAKAENKENAEAEDAEKTEDGEKAEGEDAEKAEDAEGKAEDGEKAEGEDADKKAEGKESADKTETKDKQSDSAKEEKSKLENILDKGLGLVIKDEKKREKASEAVNKGLDYLKSKQEAKKAKEAEKAAGADGANGESQASETTPSVSAEAAQQSK